MAGNFAGGEPEYNVRIDVASAKAVFERWPTPMVVSGFEIGHELLYPAASIERDFVYAAAHPIAASYRAYAKMPYNRPTWDLTAVLEAVRPDAGYFTRSNRVRCEWNRAALHGLRLARATGNICGSTYRSARRFWKR